jgi:hypothetical protein
MSDPSPPEPFFLIIIDHDREFFCVEGPMTDDAPWNRAAARARGNGRSIQRGPAGADRDALVAEYQQASRFGGVPPGSIVRLRQ